jgi:hypothetical protein
MPSPHLEKGDMAIIANCLEDIRQRKKQKGSKPKLHRGCEGGEKSERTLAAMAFADAVSPTSCLIPLKKTSNNERSCEEDAGNASIHDQHSPSSNLWCRFCCEGR